MIADQPPQPSAFGAPDPNVLEAGAFHGRIVSFIKQELPVWRDRPERPAVTDEGRLNQFLSVHLNSASRHQGFDLIQFLHEPHQTAGRAGDIGVMPGQHTIVVEGRTYHDFQQLLPIECKRLPTPSGSKRNDLEYIHGLPGHRSGGIERFKHGLHGPDTVKSLMIGYVQEETFDHWFAVINARLRQLALDGTDTGLWAPEEPLSNHLAQLRSDVRHLISTHRRSGPKRISDSTEMEHLWLMMN